MNWVVVIAGLLPLWAALFIAFSNMKVLKEGELELNVPVQSVEPVQELDLLEETRVEEPEKKGLFAGLRSRFSRKQDIEEPQDELAFEEDPLDEEIPVVRTGIGLPRGIRKIWGAALVLIFFACLAYGSEVFLDYIFKQYRWVIGTPNPWTEQLAMNTTITTALAGLGFMAATLRTGIYLIRN